MRIIMSSGDGHRSDEAEIVRGVLMLARALRRSVPAGEVSGGGLALLAALHQAGPMSAVALAQNVGLQPQSLSRLLPRLESDAMIEREVDAADRRRHVIALTRHGREALKRAMGYRREWLAAAMSDRLDTAERALLLRASSLMLRLIEDPAAKD
jgi:DNA-binding MarR family transcriptional regulator